MLSVLLIDDDEDLLEMVEMVLTNSSMRVETSTSGASLMNSLRTSNPDIIVMDIYLGDSDGRNLCQRLKSSKEYGHIPVILYSAGVITPESINEAGADEFIPKPFRIDDLVQKIRALTTAA
jgi:DNA-binding response OmpR family regulator